MASRSGRELLYGGISKVVPYRLSMRTRMFAGKGKGARIFVEDEASNPSGSFEARLASVSVYQAQVADELASAAELMSGKTKRMPVVILRGFEYPKGQGCATDLVREQDKDLFK